MTKWLMIDSYLRLLRLLTVEGRLLNSRFLNLSEDFRTCSICTPIYFEERVLFLGTSRSGPLLILPLILCIFNVFKSHSDLIKKFFIYLDGVSRLFLTGIHHSLVGHLD